MYRKVVETINNGQFLNRALVKEIIADYLIKNNLEAYVDKVYFSHQKDLNETYQTLMKEKKIMNLPVSASYFPKLKLLYFNDFLLEENFKILFNISYRMEEDQALEAANSYLKTIFHELTHVEQFAIKDGLIDVNPVVKKYFTDTLDYIRNNKAPYNLLTTE